MRKRIAAAAIAVSTLGGAGLGALAFSPFPAGAQSTTTAPADSSTGSTAPTAEKGKWMSDALAPLVSKGTITQAQADAVTSALEAAKPAKGPGGPGGGRDLDTAAKAIGIDAATLRTELGTTGTIAKVAQAHNVDPQKVIDAIVAEIKAHEAAEVAAGEHTQAEVDAKLADVNQRVTDMVNNAAPTGGRGGGGRH